jgi:predicted ATP-grasp superfamily ATP-dependent carboligase
MRVLITDSNNRSALAATRSLARAGHTVVTAGDRHISLAAASRHSAAFVHYPRPSQDPDGFCAAISTAVTTHKIDVLLPMTEITTLLLAGMRGTLPASCTMPFASEDAISEASDKVRVIALARELGVPTPASTILTSADDVPAAMNQLTYPVVIKPGRSRVRTATGWISNSVSYAHTDVELALKLRELPSETYPVLLQERIRGPGVGLFACYDRGRPVALFSHKRLREKPPSGGVSVLSESVPLNPDAVEYASRLLNRLTWHGVAMVEFKQDDRDGTLRLMEINGRFWGSLQLAINAGVDFPAIAIAIAGGAQPEAVTSYHLGIRNRWFLGDLDVLLAVLFRSRRRLNVPAGFPSRRRLAWDFMHLWGRELHYEVWDILDPYPGLVEIWQWLTRR